MIFVYSMTGIFHGRYLVDCAVFFVFSSLFCAYYWCDDKQRVCVAVVNDVSISQNTVRLKIIYGLLMVSIFVGMFLFVTWSDLLQMYYYDPALYRYLEYSLGVIERF